MDINKDLILKVAKNARLNLSEDEVKEFLPQFKEIMNTFSIISKVNTDKINPSFIPVDIKNVMRDDKKGDCVLVNDILKNAKHKKGDYFLGPKAL